MTEPTCTPAAAVVRPAPLAAVVVLIVAVYGCAIYANLSFAVTNGADYRFFPPFRRHVNANENHALAMENFNIARSLTAGKGFAHPFNGPSGPTAWMPPLLPGLLAGILCACGGDRVAVMAAVVFLQLIVLVGTGLLVVRLGREVAPRLGAGLAVAAFLGGLLSHFHICFQTTSDCWLVLLAIDLLLAGLCWWRPLRDRRTAALWGLCGAFCAFATPIAGFTWAVLSVLVGIRRRNGSPPAVALLVAALVLTPWTVRNYLVFGRLIPIKSNVAYELYQSQCLQPNGLLQLNRTHPYDLRDPEGREYLRLGEAAFLDRKWEQFRQNVCSDPADFAARVATRFLGATLWFVPYDPAPGSLQPWVLALARLVHPLPFLAVLLLLATARRRRLSRIHWVLIGISVCYFLPYVGISYCERYAVPLLGVKVLLVLAAAERLLAFRVSAPPPGSATG
jgi:hypothetical protein